MKKLMQHGALKPADGERTPDELQFLTTELDRLAGAGSDRGHLDLGQEVPAPIQLGLESQGGHG